MKNHAVEDLTMPELYDDGYNTGYEWLNRNINGANFRHPSEPKGYIPGGPWLYVRADSRDSMYRSLNNRMSNLRNEWTRGFVNGINDYVRENKLDYPQVPER